MVQPVIQDQYTATRAFFASVIGLLFVESLVRLPAYLSHKYHHGQPQARKCASHWKVTVLVHRLFNFPSPIPFAASYHATDLVRFLAFAALNVVFGLNDNEYTTDYKLYGWLCIANGGLALLFGARTNLFCLVLRVPSPVVLQYHRWAGLATIAHGTVHFAYNIMHYIETDQLASSFVNTRIRVGAMAWVSLALIFLTALPIVRRRGFELFYYAHALFFVFMVGALIHTTNGPEFLLPGFSLWVVDRAIRFAYNFRRIEVDSVTHYEGDVTKFKVRGVKTRHPGQVVWVQIPDVSFLNWHPFTVASAPGQNAATIAVRGLGGYTKGVQRAHDDSKGDSQSAVSRENQITMRLDGPYGVGGIQWGQVPVTVLIAGGVGITPGMSIASHLIQHAAACPSRDQVVSHVHLLWIVKDDRHIEWFREELRELHARSLQDDVPATLDITIHATASSASAPDSLGREESFEMQALEPADCQWAVNKGRPDVAAWLSQVKSARPGMDAAINVCGPRALITETRRAAGAASSKRGIYYVEEEVFEL